MPTVDARSSWTSALDWLVSPCSYYEVIIIAPVLITTNRVT